MVTLGQGSRPQLNGPSPSPQGAPAREWLRTASIHGIAAGIWQTLHCAKVLCMQRQSLLDYATGQRRKYGEELSRN